MKESILLQRSFLKPTSASQGNLGALESISGGFGKGLRRGINDGRILEMKRGLVRKYDVVGQAELWRVAEAPERTGGIQDTRFGIWRYVSLSISGNSL